MNITIPKSILMAAGWATVPLALVLLLSCGDDDPRQGDSPVGKGYVLSPAERSMLAERVPEQQKFAFADNVVTFEEYEAAVLSTLDCARDAGITITDAAPNSRQDYFWNATWPSEFPGGGAALEACRQTYLNSIALVWSRYTAPTQAELQEARDAIAKCLREKGIDVPDPVDRETLARIGGLGNPVGGASPDFAECAAKIQEQFVLPGFAG